MKKIESDRDLNYGGPKDLLVVTLSHIIPLYVCILIQKRNKVFFHSILYFIISMIGYLLYPNDQLYTSLQ